MEEEKKEAENVFIPKFIQKLSSSYYKKWDSKLNPEEYIAKQKENKQKYMKRQEEKKNKKKFEKDEGMANPKSTNRIKRNQIGLRKHHRSISSLCQFKESNIQGIDLENKKKELQDDQFKLNQNKNLNLKSSEKQLSLNLKNNSQKDDFMVTDNRGLLQITETQRESINTEENLLSSQDFKKQGKQLQMTASLVNEGGVDNTIKNEMFLEQLHQQNQMQQSGRQEYIRDMKLRTIIEERMVDPEKFEEFIKESQNVLKNKALKNNENKMGANPNKIQSQKSVAFSDQKSNFNQITKKEQQNQNLDESQENQKKLNQDEEEEKRKQYQSMYLPHNKYNENENSQFQSIYNDDQNARQSSVENTIQNMSHYQSAMENHYNSVMSASKMDKSNGNCLVCFDKFPDSVFFECGHGGVCYECSLEVWKNQGECFLCRKPIIHVIQIDPNQRKGNFLKVISSTQMVHDQSVEDSKQSQNHEIIEEVVEEDN